MKKRDLFNNVMSVLHILLLLYCSYMLFVRPHLNSATPVRDVSRDVVGIIVPAVLMMCLLSWVIKKIKIINENKIMENKLPLNWNDAIPPETMRVIWKILAACVLVVVVGLPTLFMGFGWLAGWLFP